MSATANGSLLQNLGIATTLLDAVDAFRRGEHWAAAGLLGAAALSQKIPGFGVAASVLLRLVRRLR